MNTLQRVGRADNIGLRRANERPVPRQQALRLYASIQAEQSAKDCAAKLADLPSWFRRGLAAVSLVPVVTIGIWGGQSAMARKAVQETPVATVVPAQPDKRTPASQGGVSPQAIGGAVVGVMLAAGAMRLMSSSSSSAQGPDAPQVHEVQKAASSITPEIAKDAINTAIMLEMSTPEAGREADPVAELDMQTDGAFSRVMAQHRALLDDPQLLAAHPNMSRLVSLVTKLSSKDLTTPVWSLLYDKQAVTTGAEVGLGPFLEDIRKPYPDLHAVLSSTTPDFVVAVMCALGAWAQRTKMVASELLEDIYQISSVQI